MYFGLQSLYIFNKVKNNSYPKLLTKSCSRNVFNHKIIFSQRLLYCVQYILSLLPSVSATLAISFWTLSTPELTTTSIGSAPCHLNPLVTEFWSNTTMIVVIGFVSAKYLAGSKRHTQTD